MTNYQRIAKGARAPHDVVVVTVRTAFGRAVADVAAVEQIAGNPTPVHLALLEAEKLRQQLDLRTVVVVIDDEKIWRDAWGDLFK